MAQATLPKGAKPGGGFFQGPVWRRFRRNPLGVIGLSVIVLFALVAVFAPLIAPAPSTNFGSTLGIPNRMAQDGYSPIPVLPSAQHPFGLTQDGYDILFGLVWGTRSAFLVGLLVTGISVLIGGLVGLLAGYYGGWVDNLLMRTTDVVYAFPTLVLLITIVVVLGRSLTSIIVAVAVLGWANYARLIRSEVLKVKRLEYVESARSLGAFDARIVLRHVLPNSLTSVLTQVSLDIGSVVVVFASLSFLGVGAPTGFPDWGQLINLSRAWITQPQYWFTYVYPGVTLVLFGVAWNLLADAIREATDPRGG